MQGGLKGHTGVLITHTHGRYDPVFLNHFTHTHTQSTYIRSMNRAREEHCEQIIQNSVTKPNKQTLSIHRCFILMKPHHSYEILQMLDRSRSEVLVKKKTVQKSQDLSGRGMYC